MPFQDFDNNPPIAPRVIQSPIYEENNEDFGGGKNPPHEADQTGEAGTVKTPKKPKEKKRREDTDASPAPKKAGRPRKNPAANDGSAEKSRQSQVNFRMNAEDHRRLKMHCAAIDTNLGDLLNDLARLEMYRKYRCCNADCGFELLALSDDLMPAKCPCCDAKVKLVTD